MKLTKKQAESLLKGWEYVQKYNQTNERQISKEEFIDAFFLTLKEGNDFCVKCICEKCDIKCKYD